MLSVTIDNPNAVHVTGSIIGRIQEQCMLLRMPDRRPPRFCIQCLAPRASDVGPQQPGEHRHVVEGVEPGHRLDHPSDPGIGQHAAGAAPELGLHLVVALRKRPWAAPHQKQTAAAAQRGPTPETKAALDGCGWHCLGNVRGWGSAQKDGGRR